MPSRARAPLFSISFKQYMAVVLLLLCGTFLSHSGAQVLYGSLTGNIADPNGASIAGAEVEALNGTVHISVPGRGFRGHKYATFQQPERCVLYFE